MQKRNLRVSLLLVVSLAMSSACGGSSTSSSEKQAILVPASEAEAVLINRNWMDLWPRTETEKLQVFRFVPNMGGGVYQDRTLFKGSFELFSFRVVKGTSIEFDLHHEHEKMQTGFRIDKVEGHHPFDLRLTLDDSPRGPNVFYGRSSETTSDLAFGTIE